MWIQEVAYHLPSVIFSRAPYTSSFSSLLISSLNFFFLNQDKLDIRQAVDGGHVVSGLTEVVVKDKEQVSA